MITAGHGADALAKAQQQWPDLVISDCMMPVMNGLELCAALRSLPGGATLPIILCSGARSATICRNPVTTCSCASRFLRAIAGRDCAPAAAAFLIPPSS
jgi:CheY-like chemotaxis protein